MYSVQIVFRTALGGGNNVRDNHGGRPGQQCCHYRGLPREQGAVQYRAVLISHKCEGKHVILKVYFKFATAVDLKKKI